MPRRADAVLRRCSAPHAHLCGSEGGLSFNMAHVRKALLVCSECPKFCCIGTWRFFLVLLTVLAVQDRLNSLVMEREARYNRNLLYFLRDTRY